jgi:hypothetical protein
VVGSEVDEARLTNLRKKAGLSLPAAAGERCARTHPRAAFLGDHDQIHDPRLLAGHRKRRNREAHIRGRGYAGLRDLRSVAVTFIAQR